MSREDTQKLRVIVNQTCGASVEGAAGGIGQFQIGGRYGEILERHPQFGCTWHQRTAHHHQQNTVNNTRDSRGHNAWQASSTLAPTSYSRCLNVFPPDINPGRVRWFAAFVWLAPLSFVSPALRFRTSSHSSRGKSPGLKGCR